MAWSFDSGKAVAWRRRVRRFGRSGLTVVRFCEEEGVSAASFYRWRKRLSNERPIVNDARPAKSAAHAATAFRAVRVTPADAPMSICLPGDIRVEVPMENLDAVRAVLGELLRREATPDGRPGGFLPVEGRESSC